jgi:rhodanese-related sulfurtransferase
MMNVLVLLLVLGAAVVEVYPWLTVRFVRAEELDRWHGAPDLVVVDLRRAAEYEAGHIPGAISVPIVRLRQVSRVLSPEARVVLVDRTGYRALQAFQSLKRRGFRRVWCLRGGMLAWVSYRRHRDLSPAATTIRHPS